MRSGVDMVVRARMWLFLVGFVVLCQVIGSGECLLTIFALKWSVVSMNRSLVSLEMLLSFERVGALVALEWLPLINCGGNLAGA